MGFFSRGHGRAKKSLKHGYRSVYFNIFAWLFSLGVCAHAGAAQVLVVNGSGTTSEAGTTANITSNLQTRLVANGDTVTIADTVPADLSSYDEIWDLRFFNAGALSAGVSTQYLTFLQSGNKLFLMGENVGFTTRNDSIFDFVSAAGGGSLASATVNSTQDVASFLQSPAAITSITYDAPGGVGAAGVTGGSGEFLTVDGATGGTAVGYPTGSLPAALTGSLVAVFDVNFMAGQGTNGLEFLENLTGYVSGGGNVASRSATPVPVMSSLSTALLALFMGASAWLVAFRRKKSGLILR